MNKHALMVAEVTELMRFDFVLFSFGIIDVALTCAETP